MRRKRFRVILFLLALLILASALSQLIYGRSLRTTIYEWMLRRRFATTQTPEAEQERLATRRTKKEKPYSLPKDISFTSTLDEKKCYGMQVFILNADADSGTDVLYLHGGAYINPFNAYQWRFMDRLATSANCRVIAPAYHLAPYADYARAYADLTGLWLDLAAEGRRAILMGDSAGGGLALGLAEQLAQTGEPLPERLILFSPWVDVSMENPDILKYVDADPILHLEIVKVHGQCWANGADTKFWQISPIYGDMAGLPPVTLYCGTRELLYPDIVLLSERLKAAGVETELRAAQGLNHDYPLMPIPEAERAISEVIKMVQ